MTNHWNSMDRRMLRSKIKEKVQQAMQEYKRELELRRQKLNNLLREEKLMYEKEIKIKQIEEEKEKERKRLDLINLHKLERKMADEEFRNRKQLQRQIENSQAHRELESKKILIETKIAQAYQIEEKKLLRRKDQETDNYWLNINQKDLQMKEKQAEDQEKVRKEIAKFEQLQNLKQSQILKDLRRAEKLLSQEETEAENQNTLTLGKKMQENEKIYEYRKKKAQHSLLTEQIEINRLCREMGECAKKEEGFLERASDQANTVKLWEKDMQEKLKNREWHKAYLAHQMEEKRQRNVQAMTLDEMFSGKSCILEQRNKKPYNKNAR